MSSLIVGSRVTSSTRSGSRKGPGSRGGPAWARAHAAATSAATASLEARRTPTIISSRAPARELRLGLVDRDRPEADPALAGEELGQPGQVGADHRRDLGIAARRGTAGHHDDRLAVREDLD